MAYNHTTGDGERIFSPLYADVWETTLKHLNGSAVKVYIALLMHTTQQNRTWFMSIDEIAEDAGVGRTAAAKGKDKLIEMGLVEQSWRYRDEAGDYHLTDTRPPPRLQGKNVYKVNVKPASVDAGNREVEDNRCQKTDSIDAGKRHLVDAGKRQQTIAPTTQPPTEPLSPLTPQGGTTGGELAIIESISVPEKPVPKKKRTQGEYLPEGWFPSQRAIELVRENNPTITDDFLRREHMKFTDHWLAASHHTARKKDWDAAWRNWMNRAMDYNPPRGRNTGKPTMQEINTWTTQPTITQQEPNSDYRPF